MYTIHAPSSIRSDSNYNVAITLHEAKAPAAFKVKVFGPNLGLEEEVKVGPSTTEIITFKVPEIDAGEYKITAQGVDGVYFKKSHSLSYTAIQKQFIFTQTDKATYKPGDLVRFRILFIDNNIRPIKPKESMNLTIQDGEQNLLKNFKNLEIRNGVYSDTYQLTDYASLGHWNLLVGNEKEENLESKSFEVAKYVLPKFQVKVETPKDISISDEIIKVNIRSNYTYGKAVTGKAVVTVKSESCFYSEAEEMKVFAEKSTNITGKATVEFHLKNDLNYAPKTDYYLPPLQVTAVVEEELSGIKQSQSAEVTLHRDRYKVEGVEIPRIFHPDQECIINVAVMRYDGRPISDSKNPVTLLAESDEDDKILKFNSFLSEKGVATFQTKFPIVKEKTSSYSLRARYSDCEGTIGYISQYQEKSGDYIELKVETKNPVTYKDIVLSLKSNKPLESFVYHVIKKGDIIKTESVKLTDNETSYCIILKPTFAMAPSIKVLAYLYSKGDLLMKEVRVDFEKELQNQIEIETLDEAKPGEELEVKLITDPNSFIGLMGVDQSVLLLKSGNDLQASSVIDQIQNNFFGQGCYRGGCFPPRSSSPLITITNADFEQDEYLTGFPKMYAMASRSGFQLMSSAQHDDGNEMTIRKEFPETWLWEDINSTESITTIKRVVPDTITSWILTGFALNDKIGLGITKEARKLKVFQPFFVSLNLPYSIKRGEVISVPISVFNYMENEISAEITLENVDDEFEFIKDEAPTKSVMVSPEIGSNITFKIRATKVGEITLKVRAISPVAGDIVHQLLRVEAEGVTEFVNKAVLLDLSHKTEDQAEIRIEIPEEAVPDSTNIEVSIVGDILGPVMKNLDKLVRKPYGCGEQNMVNFVPNILVLHYLNSTNQPNKAIESKAKRFLELGYERQLSYRHKDGSFSAFGQSSCNFGSTWLTAYVARSFQQAKAYSFIDPSIVTGALEFLASAQQEDGSFKENGKLFDNHHDNEKDKGLALTAFVLLAFIENEENMSIYNETITKGLQFLSDTIGTTDLLYSDSIAAYALSLAKHQSTGKALEALECKAIKSGDKKFWIVKKTEEESKAKRWCSWPQNHDVEVTSYAFLAFVDKLSLEEMLPTVKWLISKRNSNGGFSSTQDTVMGLHALTKFSEKGQSGNSEMQIEFKGDKPSGGIFKVGKENSLLLQSHTMDPSTKTIEVIAHGRGTSLLQVSYRFNMNDKDEKPAFTVKASVKALKGALLVLEVISNYIGGEESNMVVLEICLPSGFIVDKDSFDNVLEKDRVKKVETKNDETVVIVYFESLTKDEVRLDVAAIKTHDVDELKKSALLIYDYYDNSKMAKEFYSL